MGGIERPGDPDDPGVDGDPHRQRREKVADQLVQQAQGRIAAANRTLLALVLLILFSWLNNLSSIHVSSRGGDNYWRRIQNVQEAKASLISACLDTGAKPLRRLPPSNAEERKEIQEDCQKKRAAVGEAFNKLDTSFDFLQFKLPAVHLRLHPLLLMLLVSITIAYALLSRREILGLVTEAVKIYRKEMRWKSRHSGAILWTVPFWLWPVWSRMRDGLTRSECSEYLSLQRRERFRPALLNLAAAALLSIAVHIVYVQRELSQRQLGFTRADLAGANSPYLAPKEVADLAGYYTSLSYTGSAALDLVVLLLVLAPALAIMAFERAGTGKPSRRGPGLAPLPRLKSLSRRNLMFAGGTMLAVGLVIPRTDWSLGAVVTRIVRWRPRFRAKKKLMKTGLLPGLYVVRPRDLGAATAVPVPAAAASSGAYAKGEAAEATPVPQPDLYHFVRRDGTVGGVRQKLRAGRLQKAAWAPFLDPNELSALSRMEIVERKAIELLRSRGSRAGLDQLWSAVISPEGMELSPERDLRLYDLIAGLAVRYGQSDDRERLMGLVSDWLAGHERGERPKSENRRREAERLAGLLRERLEKWRRPDNAWHARWRTSPRTWRGIDIPAPDADRR